MPFVPSKMFVETLAHDFVLNMAHQCGCLFCAVAVATEETFLLLKNKTKMVSFVMPKYMAPHVSTPCGSIAALIALVWLFACVDSLVNFQVTLLD